MAPPPRPGRQPASSKQDEDLWKSYTQALQSKFFSSLDPKTEVFSAAPVGVMGIPAGNNIPQEITNKGVCDIGDTLLQLNVPMLGSGSQTYIQRLQSVLGAVKLRQNPDMGAMKRLQDAKAKLQKLEDAANATRAKAMEAFAADEDKGQVNFMQWCRSNYPSFVALNQELQAAAATEASLRAQIEGPGASLLNSQKQKIFNANFSDQEITGLNMPCATVFGNVSNGSSDIPQPVAKLLRPAYTIDSSYKDTVESWIRNSGGENKFSLTFNIADARSVNWNQFGITDVGQNSGFSYNPFFKARYSINHQTKEEHIMAQEVGTELSVQLTATDIGIFTIKPGNWDVPNVNEMYQDFERDAIGRISPAARVDQVILGYKVGMKISMSAKVAERVNDLTQKAKGTGGGVSFFGFEVGFGAGSQDVLVNSSSTSIDIRKDFGYPVLLGVKGKKLAGLQRGH